jgi:hypothetical protein
MKSVIISDKMRGMVQTCCTVGLWEGRNHSSKSGGQISLKGSPEEKLLRPEMVDQKND